MATTVAQCTACKVRNRVANDATGRPRCSRCHTDLPWLIEVGTDQFDRVIETSKLPVLVADGAEISRRVGALPADAIRRWVDGALSAVKRA